MLERFAGSGRQALAASVGTAPLAEDIAADIAADIAGTWLAVAGIEEQQPVGTFERTAAEGVAGTPLGIGIEGQPELGLAADIALECTAAGTVQQGFAGIQTGQNIR